MKKKIVFCKTFRGMPNFVELQSLVNDLVYSLELSVFINTSLPYIIFDEVDKGLGHDIKKR